MTTIQILALGTPSLPDLLVLSIFVALPIWATILSIRRFQGAAIPLWILLSWLMPFIGALITIIAAYSSTPNKDAKRIR